MDPIKNLLIGATDLYQAKTLVPWMASLRETGCTDDIVLLVYRSPDLGVLQQYASKYKVKLFLCDSDSWGNSIQHNSRGRDTQVHQMRMFHAWQLLNDITDDYKYVFITDTKDVIFQKNPFEWIKHRGLTDNDTKILATSEGVRYQDEPWGADNLMKGFGPYVFEKKKTQAIANVGVIGGLRYPMQRLFLKLFLLGENRYIPNDQSSFNVVSECGTLILMMENGMACHCGTALDPTKDFSKVYMERKPVIKDGWVWTPTGELFTIVHQWDRVPELKEAIEKRYAEF